MNEVSMDRGRDVPERREADDLKDFSRTIAEIQWLLVILVLLYQIVQERADESTAAVYLGLTAYVVSVVAFRYVGLFRKESRWKLAVETWVMIIFITWVLYHSGSVESPLLNLYLLTIVISALTLGTLSTLLEVVLIAACYVFLWYTSGMESPTSGGSVGGFVTQLAPMLLVAYITTMLSADIRSAMSRIKAISETDELTGTYNVRAFTALASHHHKQSVRYRQLYSIVMVDSDNLKTINDGFGHEAGNQLLKLMVTCLQQGLRDTDVIARYGGDEFVLMLPQTGMDGAFALAERMRKNLESTPLNTQGSMISTTMSAGVATYPEHGKDLATVMNSADQALYSSKKGGRNRTSVSGDPQAST
ncbi:MAG: GGDEF domain-containing protein [Pseudomonadota bacterium]